eukprot:4247426-Amphidinium_carterae.2
MERPRGRARRGFAQDDPVVEFAAEQLKESVGGGEVSPLWRRGLDCWLQHQSQPDRQEVGGEKVLEKAQIGDLAIVYTVGGTSLVAREPATFEAGEGDARVLPVKWRGTSRRRGFQEAVEMMESNEYGDEEMEGEMTCMWYLEKICGTGLDPVARHRAWQTDSGIPSGDRSVYEHQMIALVLQTAATRDQLNLGSLLCMEMLVRRAMLIESAHSHSPGNPDYSHGSDFMGLGEQRGGALVNPSLLKMAASKATERTQVMKERRKMAEELRLRTNPQNPKSDKGEGKGK